MSFKKTVLITFIIFGSVSLPVKAMSKKWFSPQIILPTFYYFHTEKSRRSFLYDYLNSFRYFRTYPHYIFYRFPYFEMQHAKYTALRYQSSIHETTINLSKKPYHKESSLKTFQEENSFFEQDKKSAHLVYKLMNDNDTTSFKTIGTEFLELTDLHQDHPELKQLVEKHIASPNTQTFVEELKNLSKQKKLPKQFNQAFQEQERKISTMGWVKWYGYVYKINKKFS